MELLPFYGQIKVLYISSFSIRILHIFFRDKNDDSC